LHLHHNSQRDKKERLLGDGEGAVFDVRCLRQADDELALLERDENPAADGAADTKLAALPVDCLKRECSV
jgi:hypothetical protein